MTLVVGACIGGALVVHGGACVGGAFKVGDAFSDDGGLASVVLV
jgi:hypothetical protein